MTPIKLEDHTWSSQSRLFYKFFQKRRLEEPRFIVIIHLVSQPNWLLKFWNTNHQSDGTSTLFSFSLCVGLLSFVTLKNTWKWFYSQYQTNAYNATYVSLNQINKCIEAFRSFKILSQKCIDPRWNYLKHS